MNERIIIETNEYGVFSMTQNACEEQLERLAFEIIEIESQIENARKNKDWNKVVELERKKILIDKDVIFFSNNNMAYFKDEILPSIKEISECIDLA